MAGQVHAADSRQHASTATRQSVVESLDTHGYCIVEGFVKHTQLQALRGDLSNILRESPTGRNKFEGFRTQRLYALFAKSRQLDSLAVDPLVLGVVERVLGGPHVNISSDIAICIGAGETAQVLHRDDGKYPIPRPHQEVIVNTMWALDDFTLTNGASKQPAKPDTQAQSVGRDSHCVPMVAARRGAALVVPGSHLARTDGWASSESEGSRDTGIRTSDRELRGHSTVLSAAQAKLQAPGPASTAAPPPSPSSSETTGGGSQGQGESTAVAVTMPSGSVLFYRGSLVHGGGASIDSAARGTNQ